VNWGNYDLVVIDESHNFRNKKTPQAGGETRYDRLMRKVIREGVKTRVLMLSATPVNNRLADLRNQIAFATEGDEGDDLARVVLDRQPDARQHRANAVVLDHGAWWVHADVLHGREQRRVFVAESQRIPAVKPRVAREAPQQHRAAGIHLADAAGVDVGQFELRGLRGGDHAAVYGQRAGRYKTQRVM
jgi:hypothetical protein